MIISEFESRKLSGQTIESDHADAVSPFIFALEKKLTDKNTKADRSIRALKTISVQKNITDSLFLEYLTARANSIRHDFNSLDWMMNKVHAAVAYDRITMKAHIELSKVKDYFRSL